MPKLGRVLLCLAVTALTGVATAAENSAAPAPPADALKILTVAQPPDPLAALNTEMDHRLRMTATADGQLAFTQQNREDLYSLFGHQADTVCALKKDRRCQRAHYNLAMMRYWSQDYSGALDEFTIADNINPIGLYLGKDPHKIFRGEQSLEDIYFAFINYRLSDGFVVKIRPGGPGMNLQKGVNYRNIIFRGLKERKDERARGWIFDAVFYGGSDYYRDHIREDSIEIGELPTELREYGFRQDAAEADRFIARIWSRLTPAASQLDGEFKTQLEQNKDASPEVRSKYRAAYDERYVALYISAANATEALNIRGPYREILQDAAISVRSDAVCYAMGLKSGCDN